MNERIDTMGFGDLQIVQRPEDFCYGIDAVILAHFAATESKANRPLNVVELGTGNGALSLIFSHKMEECNITAVEVQQGAALLAQRNVELNGLEDRIQVLNQDILDLPRDMDSKVDVVITNPPYGQKSGNLICKNQAKAIARCETTAVLKDFLDIGSRLLLDKGSLYMIHRPSRLVDILYLGRLAGLEGKKIQPVAPMAGKKPNLVMIHFVKNGGPQLTLMPELYVYDQNHQYTDEIQKIYERK